ncbi:MAG: InlB B-repeat-containing protein, partial [Eubacterium sp.]|nr:InlB B-repeat-containing protein [Eubacterium sp.]
MSKNIAALSEMSKGSSVSIQNCTIDMDIKGYRQVGSTISYMASNSLNINNCGIQGTIFGMSEDVFGIHSEPDYNIKNTYVSVLTKSYVKGKETLYNSDLCEGNGIPLTTEQMKSKSSYKNFDFESVWNINPNINNGFPYIRQAENKKINYVLNGGTNVAYAETDYIPGNVVTLPKPTRSGYAFEGWYKTADFSGNPITQISASEKSDIMLYARWSCTHTYKTTTTKATTKKNGNVVKKCSVCGASTKTTIYSPKTITLSKTSYVYNGKAQKPTVTVKDSKGKKIATSNYTVTYPSGRKNVGKYTVTIKFKGNYSGTVKKTFTIKSKATTLSSVTAKSKGFTAKWK